MEGGLGLSRENSSGSETGELRQSALAESLRYRDDPGV